MNRPIEIHLQKRGSESPCLLGSLRARLMLLGVLFWPVSGADAAPLTFAKDIQPLLEQSCLPCHNKTKSEGGLLLETPKAMLEGGESGPAIQPNHGQTSLLYETAARKKKPFMPPEANKAKAPALSSSELELLKRWIDEGASGEPKAKKPVAWNPMPGGVQTPSALAVSPNGRTAAAARGNVIAVYSLELGVQTARFVAHPDIVGALAFSPDGQWLASGSRGEIKIWRKTPPPSVVLPEEASLLASSADGKFKAEAAVDQPVRLLAAETGQEIAKLLQTAESFDRRAEAESKSAAAKFEADFLDKEITATKEKIAKLKVDLEKVQKEHASLLPKKDERTKALAEDEARRDAQMMQRDSVDEAFMQATQTLDTAKDTEKTALIRVASEEKVLQNAASDAKDAAAQALVEAKDAAKKATDTRTAAESALKAAKDKLDAVQKDYTETIKAVGTAAGAISSAKTAELNAEAFAAALARSQEELKRLETSAVHAKEALTQAQTAAGTVAAAYPAPTPATAIAFLGDGAILLTRHTDGRTHAWNGKTGAPLADASLEAQWELVRTIGDASKLDSPLSHRINALAFSPDGKQLASGGGEPSRSGELKLWDPTSGKLLLEVPKAHKDAVLSLDFSRDGKLLASGSADRAARVWELPSGKLFRNLEAHSSHVLSVSLRGDSRRLASAGADNAVKTWDLEKSDVVTTFANFTKEVSFLQYLNGGDELLAVSGTPALRILKDGGGEVRAQTDGLKKFITATASTPDGKIQLIGEADGTVRQLNREGKVQAEWLP